MGDTASFTLLSAIFVTIVTIWGVLDTELGGAGLAAAWSYHPVFMSLAFFLMATWGQLAYSDKLWLRLPFGEGRIQHSLAWLVSGVLAGLGYYYVFKEHQENGHSQVASGMTSIRQAHVYMGYGALVLLAIQVCVVLVRYVAGLGCCMSWDGLFGRFLYVLGVVVGIIGFWIHWNDENMEALMHPTPGSSLEWSLPFKLVLTAAAVGMLGYLMLSKKALKIPQVGM